MSARRVTWAMLLPVAVSLSCGDEAGSDANAPRDPSGEECPIESDAALCSRLGKTCGTVSGKDACGRDRVGVACGQCPSDSSACIFAGDPSGKTDATAALREAIQCSVDHQRATVRIPKGTFALSEKVLVPEGVPIVGEADASFGIDGPTPVDALPLFAFEEGLDDDAFELGANASIVGVQLLVPKQVGDTHAVLRVGGEGVTIRNVKVTEGQWSIRSEAAVDARKLFVSTVFTVLARGGMFVGRSSADARIENVHLWNPSAAQLPNAFVFHGSQGMVTSLLSAFNYTSAIELRDSEVGVAGFEGDLCGDGLIALGTSRVVVSGATFLSHFTSVDVQGSSSVTVSGSHLGSNGAATVRVRGANASIVMTGNTIVRDSAAFSAPAVSVEAARAFTFTGNTVAVHGNGLVFAGAPQIGAVFGNVIEVVDGVSAAWTPANVRDTTFELNAVTR